MARLCGGAASGVDLHLGRHRGQQPGHPGRGPRGQGARRRRVIVSAVDHLSVVNPCRELEKSGAALVFLPVDADGRVEPDAVAGRRSRRTRSLISVGAANGEIGTFSPCARSATSRATPASRFTSTRSARSGASRSPSRPRTSICSRSRPTISTVRPAPARCGSAPGVKLAAAGPRRRPGDADYAPARRTSPVVVGLGVAAELMRAEALQARAIASPALRDHLLAGVLDAVPDCRLTGSRRARLPHHLSLAQRGSRRTTCSSTSTRRDLGVDGLGLRRADRDPVARAPRHRLRAATRSDGSLCFTFGRWTAAGRRRHAARAAAPDRGPPARARAFRPPADVVRLLLFDVDGTLITSRGAGRRAVQGRPRARLRRRGRHRRLRLARQDRPADRLRRDGGARAPARGRERGASTTSSRRTRARSSTRSATASASPCSRAVAALVQRLAATRRSCWGW